MIKNSIIIPFHSNAQYLMTCLSALKTSMDDSTQLIVVQNNDSPSNFVNLNHDPKIEVLYFSKSLGYSAACNIGVELSQGEYISFCDADAISITPAWWNIHIGEICHGAKIGVVSSLLLDERTNRIRDFGIGWSGYNHFHPHRGARTDDPRALRSRRVQMACSAQMTLRRDVFRRLGGLDEVLKFHYQDLDLCLRLKAIGLDTVVVPEARAYHRGQSAHVNKSPFQIDERGYYTAKHRDILTTDIGLYVRESIEQLAARTTLFPVYDLINISTIYDNCEILEAIQPDIQVRPVLASNMAQRDSRHLNLFEVLGRDWVNRPGPFLFLVDSIDALRENGIWFSLRSHKSDIAIDRHGNAALICDLGNDL